MAEESECSQATIETIRANLRYFGRLHAHQARIGLKLTVTLLMIEAFCEQLFEKLYIGTYQMR